MASFKNFLKKLQNLIRRGSQLRVSEKAKRIHLLLGHSIAYYIYHNIKYIKYKYRSWNLDVEVCINLDSDSNQNFQSNAEFRVTPNSDFFDSTIVEIRANVGRSWSRRNFRPPLNNNCTNINFSNHFVILGLECYIIWLQKY